LSQRPVEEAITAADPGGEDVHARMTAMIRALAVDSAQTLPLGRSLLRLTVDPPPGHESGGPRRGYRRIAWIEQALEPVRDRLGHKGFERLVSQLAVVIGWEAQIVLTDLRDLSTTEQTEIIISMARLMVDAALAEPPAPDDAE
jgi:hypothetical protein